jgi:hypothetical protein
MVQGNLTALTLDHFWTANITGISSAFLAFLMSVVFFDRDWEKFIWYNPLVLGFCTFMADWLTHGSHFLGFFGEALFTGLGTFLLALFFAYRNK